LSRSSPPDSVHVDAAAIAFGIDPPAVGAVPLPVVAAPPVVVVPLVPVVAPAVVLVAVVVLVPVLVLVPVDAVVPLIAVSIRALFNTYPPPALLARQPVRVRSSFAWSVDADR